MWVRGGPLNRFLPKQVPLCVRLAKCKTLNVSKWRCRNHNLGPRQVCGQQSTPRQGNRIHQPCVNLWTSMILTFHCIPIDAVCHAESGHCMQNLVHNMTPVICSNQSPRRPLKMSQGFVVNILNTVAV